MYFFSALFPPPQGTGDRPLLADLPQHIEDPKWQIAGFFCVADGHAEADCNQHGGWVDTGMMMEAMVETMRRPGCDVRLFLEPFSPEEVVE